MVGEREYWVWARIDGTAYQLRITAASAQEAARRPLMDLHTGEKRDYPVGDGKLTIMWARVATVEVGPVGPVE